MPTATFDSEYNGRELELEQIQREHNEAFEARRQLEAAASRSNLNPDHHCSTTPLPPSRAAPATPASQIDPGPSVSQRGPNSQFIANDESQKPGGAVLREQEILQQQYRQQQMAEQQQQTLAQLAQQLELTADQELPETMKDPEFQSLGPLVTGRYLPYYIGQQVQMFVLISEDGAQIRSFCSSEFNLDPPAPDSFQGQPRNSTAFLEYDCVHVFSELCYVMKMNGASKFTLEKKETPCSTRSACSWKWIVFEYDYDENCDTSRFCDLHFESLDLHSAHTTTTEEHVYKAVFRVNDGTLTILPDLLKPIDLGPPVSCGKTSPPQHACYANISASSSTSLLTTVFVSHAPPQHSLLLFWS